MSRYIYKKENKRQMRLIIRFIGLSISLFGLSILVYFSLPILSWKLFFEPAFASSDLTSPIPKATIVTPKSLGDYISAAARSVTVDYTNASNWFPHYTPSTSATPNITSYAISIPKINIHNAYVSTVDTDLGKHLVHYTGTAIPPERGNAVIFGHSTLPSLFNPRDYKTIFANAHLLKVNDTIEVALNNKTYTYKIFSITIVEPEDMSVLTQEYDDSYLTIFTCTPPGTIWKRLVVKSRLVK